MYYNFLIEGGENNVYSFETKLGVIYDIKFKPSSYLLGNEKSIFADYIFEFIIELVYNPLERNPPLDKLISKTIAEIINHFYLSKNQSICIYICDSSDGRQDVRHKKFHNWFYENKSFGLVKIDEFITDSNGKIFPLSLLIEKNHPYFIEIISGFNAITNNYNQNK